jgi:hypothetical protein
MGSLCYMSTPSGEAGFTASAGGGGAGPYGVSGLVGLSVSNAQNSSGLAGTSAYAWASVGEGLAGVGMSGSFSENCWQTTFGWGPGFRIPAPFAGGGGVGQTWTLGW